MNNQAATKSAEHPMPADDGRGFGLNHDTLLALHWIEHVADGLDGQYSPTN